LIRDLLAKSRLALRLMREPRVPVPAKALLLLAAAYLISPLDFIPDVFPIVGQIDDLSVVLAALAAFLRICPPSATTFHEQAIARGERFTPMTGADAIIDAEWRRED
jgi:uncharacterized membrane protein YkvA (DUF1232 family)